MGAFREYMEELDAKINELKSKKADVSDIDILRLIYLDLGQKMNFDLRYTFGNKKQKKSIYDRATTEEEFDKAFEAREIICKSLAYMISMIVSRYGFKCNVEYMPDEYGKIKCGAHVYNLIETSDGQIFTIDLEEDMEYIQTGAKTKHFGIDVKDGKTCIISEKQMRAIDKELDYIPEGIYMDDILWMLETATCNIKSDDELFEFLLDNLNKYKDISKIGYRERRLYYERMIDHFFSNDRHDSKGRKSRDKIQKLDCYRIIDGEKQYVSCIITNFEREKVYLFSYESNCYDRISIGKFLNLAQNGLEVPNEGRVKKLKRFNSKMCCMDPNL